MKITRKQLRRIIRESIREGWMEDKRPSHIKSGNPRMSGMMNPEDPSVMADIERRNNMGLEEEVLELYAQEISDLAMLIHHTGVSSMEEALATDPNNQAADAAMDEQEIMWNEALLQAEEL